MKLTSEEAYEVLGGRSEVDGFLKEVNGKFGKWASVAIEPNIPEEDFDPEEFGQESDYLKVEIVLKNGDYSMYDKVGEFVWGWFDEHGLDFSHDDTYSAGKDIVEAFVVKTPSDLQQEAKTMKKLNITKEQFEKSRYFKNKYGRLEYVSESGKMFKTDKGKVLMFKEYGKKVYPAANGCTINDMGDCLIVTNKDGLNIGQCRTMIEAEVIADEAEERTRRKLGLESRKPRFGRKFKESIDDFGDIDTLQALHDREMDSMIGDGIEEKNFLGIRGLNKGTFAAGEKFLEWKDEYLLYEDFEAAIQERFPEAEEDVYEWIHDPKNKGKIQSILPELDWFFNDEDSYEESSKKFGRKFVKESSERMSYEELLTKFEEIQDKIGEDAALDTEVYWTYDPIDEEQQEYIDRKGYTPFVTWYSLQAAYGNKICWPTGAYEGSNNSKRMSASTVWELCRFFKKNLKKFSGYKVIGALSGYDIIKDIRLENGRVVVVFGKSNENGGVTESSTMNSKRKFGKKFVKESSWDSEEFEKQIDNILYIYSITRNKGDAMRDLFKVIDDVYAQGYADGKHDSVNESSKKFVKESTGKFVEVSAIVKGRGKTIEEAIENFDSEIGVMSSDQWDTWADNFDGKDREYWIDEYNKWYEENGGDVDLTVIDDKDNTQGYYGRVTISNTDEY